MSKLPVLKITPEAFANRLPEPPSSPEEAARRIFEEVHHTDADTAEEIALHTGATTEFTEGALWVLRLLGHAENGDDNPVMREGTWGRPEACCYCYGRTSDAMKGVNRCETCVRFSKWDSHGQYTREEMGLR